MLIKRWIFFFFFDVIGKMLICKRKEKKKEKKKVSETDEKVNDVAQQGRSNNKYYTSAFRYNI